MTESKSARKEALRKLAALSRKGEPATDASILELYPYGLFAREPRNPAYDRDIVITNVAVVEQGLEHAILHHFKLRPDSHDVLVAGQVALLRDLSDKIKMAYLLGVIGPLTMADLMCIRAVRNAFAHGRGHLDLDMEEFQNVLAQITAPDRWPGIIEGHHNQDQRERFIQTCFQLGMYLFVGAVSEKEDQGKIMDERMNVFRF